jgi:hypothetical protein
MSTPSKFFAVPRVHHNHHRLLHPPEHTRLRDVRHVDEDIVRGVPVQRRTQALLVKVVSDEPDAAPEDEQPVERADLDERSVRAHERG